MQIKFVMESNWQTSVLPFPVKNDLKEDALLLLLSGFTLEYVIRKVQTNQLKLNEVH